MAKTRAAATAPTTDVELDDSAEHEALTPLMRRLAREYWEIIRARAAEEGIPIDLAWLSPYTDSEGFHMVYLVVHLDVSPREGWAFQQELVDEFERRRMQLDPETREEHRKLMLLAGGVRDVKRSALARAEARSRRPAPPLTDVQLDDSAEHEALTPLMRRLAAEQWDIVRICAAEEGLPIVKAWLSPRIDMEGTRTVSLVVHFDASYEQVRALERGFYDDLYLWRQQLDREAFEICSGLFMTAVWLRREGKSANGA